MTFFVFLARSRQMAIADRSSNLCFGAWHTGNTVNQNAIYLIFNLSTPKDPNFSPFPLFLYHSRRFTTTRDDTLCCTQRDWFLHLRENFNWERNGNRDPKMNTTSGLQIFLIMLEKFRMAHEQINSGRRKKIHFPSTTWGSPKASHAFHVMFKRCKV